MVLRWRVLIITLCLFGYASLAAGEYNPDPRWKIAFVREKNLWMMKADGTMAKKLNNLSNVSGRLSWSKDGKQIAFVRQGSVQVENPDGMGGGHKCYDVFVAPIDSAASLNFWWRITDNFGSTYPEWSADDQFFVYVYDREANTANAILPDYQIYYRNYDGSIEETITPPDAAQGSYQGLQPTISPDNKLVAFIYVERKGDQATSIKDIGMVIVPRSGIQRSEEELLAEARKFAGAGGPSFSPDGKTIAYIGKTQQDNSIYLVTVADKTKQKIHTPTGGLALRPNSISWSPDGQWLIFSSYDGNIYVIDRSGNNLKQLSHGGNDYFPAFSK